MSICPPGPSEAEEPLGEPCFRLIQLSRWDAVANQIHLHLFNATTPEGGARSVEFRVHASHGREGRGSEPARLTTPQELRSTAKHSCS